MDTGKELMEESYKWEQETTKEEKTIQKIKYLKSDATYIKKIKYLRGETIDFGLENKFMEEVAEVCDIAIDAIEALQMFDNIRAEIAAIDITGRVDEHTMFVRGGKEIKQMALKIIDKYTSESGVEK